MRAQFWWVPALSCHLGVLRNKRSNDCTTKPRLLRGGHKGLPTLHPQKRLHNLCRSEPPYTLTPCSRYDASHKTLDQMPLLKETMRHPSILLPRPRRRCCNDIMTPKLLPLVIRDKIMCKRNPYLMTLSIPLILLTLERSRNPLTRSGPLRFPADRMILLRLLRDLSIPSCRRRSA